MLQSMGSQSDRYKSVTEQQPLVRKKIFILVHCHEPDRQFVHSFEDKGDGD